MKCESLKEYGRKIELIMQTGSGIDVAGEDRRVNQFEVPINMCITFATSKNLDPW